MTSPLETLRSVVNDVTAKPAAAWPMVLCRILFFSSMMLIFAVGFNFQELLEKMSPEFWQPVSLFRLIPFEILANPSLLSIAHGAVPIALLFCVLGLLTPYCYALVSICFFYLIGMNLSLGSTFHHWHLPVFVCMVYAFTKTPGFLSLDGWLFSRNRTAFEMSPEFHWPIRLIRVFMVLAYFNAGFQKLKSSGADWIFSDNLSLILKSTPTVTELGLWIARQPELCQALALYTVVVEIFAPMALFRRFRWIIWGCFLLHAGTRLTMGHYGGFLNWQICYLFWVPWDSLYRTIQDLRKEIPS